MDLLDLTSILWILQPKMALSKFIITDGTQLQAVTAAASMRRLLQVLALQLCLVCQQPEAKQNKMQQNKARICVEVCAKQCAHFNMSSAAAAAAADAGLLDECHGLCTLANDCQAEPRSPRQHRMREKLTNPLSDLYIRFQMLINWKVRCHIYFTAVAALYSRRRC
eukprot:SAG22_NODE_1074_length_5688_cov_92.719449_5_plen_166_part_00